MSFEPLFDSFYAYWVEFLHERKNTGELMATPVNIALTRTVINHAEI